MSVLSDEFEKWWKAVSNDHHVPIGIEDRHVARLAWKAAIAAATKPEQQEAPEPVAWMRRWHFDGEKPLKQKNENGRMAWPSKFKFLPVTESRIMSDDVPLFAADRARRK